MYYLRELVGTTKSGKPKTKTHYKNADYDKVKKEFTRLCEECNHTKSYYISSSETVQAQIKGG